MPTLKRITIALFLLFTFHTVRAQELTNKITAPATAPVITGTASAERVRFTAPGTVVQMQLQIYDASGQLLFDVTSKGNVLDWTLQDSGGERIAPGSYLCLVTVKSLSGKLSQRIGQALVQEKQVELQRVDATQLTGAQQQAVGPIEENGALTILKAGEAEATTVLANNGKEGQMIRDRGALTFRIGDFFSGNDTEQMRLTEEGNLGVGTSKPKFKLDVAGAVRARQGFVFNDGSTLNVNDKGALTLTDSNGTAVPNVSGTGTTGLLTKWTDGANGTLGDSVVTELNGNIGVSNPNPTAKLVVDASSSSELRFDQGIGGVTPVLSVISQPGSTTQGGASILGAGTGGSSFVFSDNLPFFLVKDTKANVVNNNLGHGTVLFTLLPTGNVGVGTTNPQSLLDVAGNINTSTQYNIGGNRILSNAGNQNVFAGVGAGQVNTGNLNAFFGKDAGLANTSGGDNSFFGWGAGHENTIGFFNSFFGFAAGFKNVNGQYNSFFGDSAGSSNISGSYNSFFGMSSGSANTADENSFFGTSSGQSNTSGGDNSFFGSSSGAGNNTGASNSFFGSRSGQQNDTGGGGTFVGFSAGKNNSSGSANTFVGFNSGLSNTTESRNTFIGSQANGAAGIINATAIGNMASVTQSNSLVLGSIKNVNNATADTNVGIGTTAPLFKFHVKTGTDQNLVVRPAVDFSANLTGIGLQSINDPNTLYQPLDLEGSQITLNVGSTGNVGIGTDSPDQKLTVNGNADKAGGGSWLAFSDERLKDIKGRFTPGLKAVMQLQPIRYEYKPDNALGLKSSGEHIGFGAQAVQKIIPEAVTTNDKGYLLVNNDPILWTMLNAVKEQQQTIEKLQQENKKLKARNSATETRLANVEVSVKRIAQTSRQHHRRK